MNSPNSAGSVPSRPELLQNISVAVAGSKSAKHGWSVISVAVAPLGAVANCRANMHLSKNSEPPRPLFLDIKWKVRKGQL